MAGSGFEDLTIPIEFVADTKEVITNVQKAEEAIQKLDDSAELAKNAIIKYAEAMEVSYKRAAQGLKKAFKEIAESRNVLDTDAVQAEIKRANQAFTDGLALATQQAADQKKQTEQQRKAELKAIQDFENKKLGILRDAGRQQSTFNRIISARRIEELRSRAKEEREIEREGIKSKKELAEVAGRQAAEASLRMATAFKDEEQARIKAIAATKQHALEQSKASQTAKESAEKQVLAATQTSGAMKKIAADAEREANALERAANKTTSAFTRMQFAAVAFAVAVGKLVFNTIRGIVGELRDAGQAAIEFSQVLFKFEIAVRGLQRVGLDTTLKEWRDFMRDLKSQFPIFSQSDITNATAQAALLEREFGLTSQQIMDLTTNAAVLSEVIGISLTQSVTNITQFLNTGYSRALRNAGLSTSKAATEQAALALGINKTVEEMNDQERAAARLQLVIGGLANIADDAGRIAETWAGQYAQAKAEIEDANIVIGQSLAPVTVAFQQLKSEIFLFIAESIPDFLTSLKDVVNGFLVFVEGTVAIFAAGMATIQEIQKNGFRSVFETGRLFGEKLRLAMEATTGGLAEQSDAYFDRLIEQSKLAVDELTSIFSDEKIGEGLEEGLGEAELDEIFKKLFDKILEAEKDYAIDLREAEEDMMADLADIDQKGLQKMYDLWQEYQDDLADIARDIAQDIEDANREHAQDIEDLNRETNQELEDANEKHREEEIKAERDFQEKLLRLREDFLLNLEDALRERDAKQVLRLIRRFNLEKTQLERERDQEKEERQDDFESELEDIREQRERKLEELRIEHRRRLEEIQIQAAREREEAKLEYERGFRDLQIDLQRQRDERMENYKAQLIDLQQHLQDRLDDLLIAFANEESLTAEMAARIRDRLGAEFGPGGNVESIYGYFVGMINNATAAAMAAIQQMQMMAGGIPDTTGVAPFEMPIAPGPPNPQISNFASGGTLFANKPTLARFGEVPEMVQFTPLSKLGRGGNPSAMMGGRAGVGGMARLEIFLSPGLEGSIIDSTLEETANMLMSVMNSR